MVVNTNITIHKNSTRFTALLALGYGSRRVLIKQATINILSLTYTATNQMNKSKEYYDPKNNRNWENESWLYGSHGTCTTTDEIEVDYPAVADRVTENANNNSNSNWKNIPGWIETSSDDKLMMLEEVPPSIWLYCNAIMSCNFAPIRQSTTEAAEATKISSVSR